MTYKTIWTGRLEFGSARSFEKVLKMYQHRVESYYKFDILLEEEEIFDEASASLTVPRFITQGTKKSWKNTISMLEYVAQFAVAGNMTAWMTENGKILHHEIPTCVGKNQNARITCNFLIINLLQLIRLAHQHANKSVFQINMLKF